MNHTRPLYHYTTGHHLPRILEAGYLRPSAAGGAPDEVPLLWLSAARGYEPTALKMATVPGGGLRVLSRAEQRRTAGNVRFRLRPGAVELLPWREACRAAGIPSRERKRLEHVGKSRGGDCRNWYATPEALPVELFAIEVETAAGWQPLESQELEGAA
jgi:hypothetical protein